MKIRHLLSLATVIFAMGAHCGFVDPNADRSLCTSYNAAFTNKTTVAAEIRQRNLVRHDWEWDLMDQDRSRDRRRRLKTGMSECAVLAGLGLPGVSQDVRGLITKGPASADELWVYSLSVVGPDYLVWMGPDPNDRCPTGTLPDASPNAIRAGCDRLVVLEWECNPGARTCASPENSREE